MSIINRIRALTGLVILLSSPSLLAQSETPATVPASFVGTYETTALNFSPASPLVNATTYTVVIGSDNSLCVNGTLLNNPVLRNGNAAEGIWKDSSNSVEYAVSNFSDSFNEVNVSGLGGAPFYAQLTGSKVSDSTSCDTGSSPTAPVVTDAINEIFALAESKLPEFFPAGSVTLIFEQFVYRFYTNTSVYLAVSDDAVFLLGGAFGESVVNIGSVSSVLATLEAYEAEVVVGGGSGGSIDLWTLTISGTFNSALVQNVAFAGITVADVPAPDLGSTGDIDTEINSSLAGLVSGISSISITVINDTETRRTFDVSFSATAPGLGAVTYELRYDYNR